MSEALVSTSVSLPVHRLWLLLSVRARVLRNRLRQAFREQPLKVFGSAASVLVIWVGLYLLLYYTLREVRRTFLEGIVATPLIFTFFFLALTGMLAFSSAILSYGALFRRRESEYLLTSPVHPQDLVIVNYLESLILSSWSLVLLGLPLMLALAYVFNETWAFYPLFLGLFLMFIPIPAALGLLLAWLAAMLFPKTPGRMMLLLGGVVLGVAIWWASGLFGEPAGSAQWLSRFYDRLSVMQNTFLPHTWVSKGINYAVQGQPGLAGFYLFVTTANSLLASVLAVAVVSHGFLPAYARGQIMGFPAAFLALSGTRVLRRSGRAGSPNPMHPAWGAPTTWIAEVLFAYMPRPQRLLATKDLKTFFRDALQWSQMAILFGLLALYVTNVRRMWVDLAEPSLQLLIAFLNLTAVSLILATFTNRFLYPLVSLDGQHLWLLALLPLRRSRLVIAKFQYALTITLIAALAVMGVSVYRLELPGPLACAHLIAASAICIGLCGISIGMGARMPVFNQRNPARIAGGFGGTMSLLLSVGLVVISLTAMGLMTYEAARSPDLGDRLSGTMRALVAAVVAVNAVAAAVTLWVGIRHFNRIEC